MIVKFPNTGTRSQQREVPCMLINQWMRAAEYFNEQVLLKELKQLLPEKFELTTLRLVSGHLYDKAQSIALARVEAERELSA